MLQTSVPNTKKETKMKKMQNVLADLSVTRKAQSSTFDVYPEDANAILEFVNFKQQSLGGEVTVAEVFNRLVRVLWTDEKFVAAHQQKTQK